MEKLEKISRGKKKKKKEGVGKFKFPFAIKFLRRMMKEREGERKGKYLAVIEVPN